MSFLWALIIGGIIGWLAGVITGRDVPMESLVTLSQVLLELGLED